MIKEVIASALLVSAPLNTTLINHVQQIVYMDDTSYWTNDIYNEDGEMPFIESYKNTKTYNDIQNSSFSIKQRTLEYYINKPEDSIISNEFYFCMYAQATNINSNQLKRTYLTIQGNIYNMYQFANAQINLITTEVPLTDTTILNFINGTDYTTIQQYNTLLTHLHALTYSQTINLNEQNYANQINDRQINYEAEEYTQYIYIIYKIEMNYASNNMPLDQPYSPFGNYAKTINYRDIMWHANVPETPTGEIVDIPGIMFTMLGMPFAFVAQAFDLTIFPGTAYAVNLSHIFLAIAGAGILLFVIKRLLK